jgi:hypothetical protein
MRYVRGLSCVWRCGSVWLGVVMPALMTNRRSLRKAGVAVAVSPHPIVALRGLNSEAYHCCLSYLILLIITQLICITNHCNHLSLNNIQRHRLTQPITITLGSKNQRRSPPNRTPIQLHQLTTLTSQPPTLIPTSQRHRINRMHPIHRIHIKRRHKIVALEIGQEVTPVFDEVIGVGEEEFAGCGFGGCEGEEFAAWGEESVHSVDGGFAFARDAEVEEVGACGCGVVGCCCG